MRYVLLDTSVYIGYWEKGLYLSTLEQIRQAFIVRHSAVVLSELYRGAKTKQALQLVEHLYKLSRPCWVPDDADWRTAGRILRQLSLQHGWETRKIQNLQNDVLITLTARKYGATIVTANRRDFEELRNHVRFSTIYV